MILLLTRALPSANVEIALNTEQIMFVQRDPANLAGGVMIFLTAGEPLVVTDTFDAILKEWKGE